MRAVYSALSIALLAVLALSACPGSGDEQEDVSLAPYLYDETFSIEPNPAETGDVAQFFFGFDDYDGDMSDARLLVRMRDEDDQLHAVELDEDAWEIEGLKHGVVRFELQVSEASQGDYLVYLIDEAGNVSNEIAEELFVNPPLPE